MYSFDKDFAKNVVKNNSNSLSFHFDNPQNNFLVLDEGPTNDNNGSFGSPEIRFSINFS